MELGIVLDTVTAGGHGHEISLWWKCSKMRLWWQLHNSVNIGTITEWVSLMVWKYTKALKKCLSDRIHILKEVRIFQSNPANLLLDEFSSHLQGKYPWKSAQDCQSMEMTRISIWYQPRDQEVTQLIRFSLESEVPKARHFIHFM